MQSAFMSLPPQVDRVFLVTALCAQEDTWNKSHYLCENAKCWGQQEELQNCNVGQKIAADNIFVL